MSKIVYLPPNLAKEYYNTLKGDGLKKIQGKISLYGTAGAINWLTGKISKPLIGWIVGTAATELPIDTFEAELDSLFQAAKAGDVDWAHGVKITSMTVNNGGALVTQNFYEPWKDEVIYGEPGMIGDFYEEDYNPMWR